MSGGERLDPAAAAETLRRAAAGLRPRVQLVLGSGLGSLARAVDDPVEVSFRDVPGLPAAGVAGHAGRFVLGRLEGEAVLVQAGRFHLYEGHPPRRVTAPVRIGAALGVETVVLTNAAGGIHRTLAPGSVLLLADQIDLTFRTPLGERTAEPEEGDAPSAPARALRSAALYDPDLQALALEAAGRRGVAVVRGTYAGVLGPSYETPAEIRMLERLGADAVGMSTVLEVVEARARGLAAVGLSLITNRAAGLGGEPLAHDAVIETADRAGGRLERVVRGVLRGISGAGGGTGRRCGERGGP